MYEYITCRMGFPILRGFAGIFCYFSAYVYISGQEKKKERLFDDSIGFIQRLERDSVLQNAGKCLSQVCFIADTPDKTTQNRDFAISNFQVSSAAYSPTWSSVSFSKMYSLYSSVISN